MIELCQFLLSDAKKSWISDEFMKVYVRKSGVYLKEPFGEFKLYSSLDIATIEVDLEFQRLGKCSEFLQIAHKLNPFQVTYIENVYDQFLIEHLIKQGYVNAFLHNCFYKPK